jgi:hypothetical protein
MLLFSVFCPLLRPLSPVILDGVIYNEGVRISEGSPEFHNDRFISCTGQGREGGGIYAETPATGVSVFSCTFISCTAETNGAGISMTDVEVLHLYDSTFITCHSGFMGGAAYIRPIRLYVRGFVGQQCSADDVGAFYYARSLEKPTSCLEVNDSTGTGGEAGAATFFVFGQGAPRVLEVLNCTSSTVVDGGSGLQLLIDNPQTVDGLLFAYAILRNNAGPSPLAANPGLPWTKPRCCEITGNQATAADSVSMPGLIWLGSQTKQLSGSFEDSVFAGNTYDYFLVCVAQGMFSLTLLRCVLEVNPVLTGQRLNPVATPDVLLLANGPFVRDAVYCPTASPGPSVTLSPLPTATATRPATDPPQTSPPPERTAAPDPTAARTVEQTVVPDRTAATVEAADMQPSEDVTRLPEQTWPPEQEYVAPWQPVRYALVVIGVLLAIALSVVAMAHLRAILGSFSVDGEAGSG